MRIGFDLDRIFIDHPPFVSDNFIDKIYKKSNTPELTYRIPSSPEQLLRRFSHYTPFRRALKDNLDVINTIAKDKKHTQYLISGRFGFLKKATDKVIAKYKFNDLFDGMYFNFENRQPHHFKDEMIKKLRLDTYVDDDLDLLKYLAKHNPNTTFYWLNNELHTKIEENLFAISHLNKIFV